jgi:CheY-like chemotaxis protein
MDDDLPAYRGGRLKVVVCDDNIDLADTQVMLLEDAGCIAQACYGGAEALQRVESLRPDVLLLDIAMPGVDGLEVCRTLRASPKWNRLRIIGQTGHGDREMLRRAAMSGFDRLLVKPVDYAELLSVLEDVKREIRRVK